MPVLHLAVCTGMMDALSRILCSWLLVCIATSLVVLIWWTYQTSCFRKVGQYWDMFDSEYDHSGDLPDDDELVEVFLFVV